MKRFAGWVVAFAAVGVATDIVAAPTAAAQNKPAGKPDDKAPKKDDKKEEKKDAGAWLENYDKALAAAKADKKVLLVEFTASDSSEPSKKLRSEILDSKEFGEWAKKNVVLLEIDTAKGKKLPDDVKKQHDDLVAKHKVTSFPTVLFLNEKGEVVGKMADYKPGTKPDAWIKEATEQVAKAKH